MKAISGLFRSRAFAVGLCVGVCFLSPAARGFSLLGPLAPWMTPATGFVEDPSLDVGGPRNLGDEFRWNVPVVTYGFDQSFQEFFGANGIAAVESAVAVFHAAQGVLQLDPARAATTTARLNLYAQASALLDLRSCALAALMEQLGLADPIRNVWVVNSVEAPLETEENLGDSPFILQRSFDPLTFEPSPFVNGLRYSFEIQQFSSAFFPALPATHRIANNFAVDQSAPEARPVAAFAPGVRGRPPGIGEYLDGLTRDDLGGLKYLLSTNNVNMEPCLPGVRAQGGGEFVNEAARPGVGNLLLKRFDPGSAPMTLQFTDTYITNGSPQTQALERVIAEPDILFTARFHPARQGRAPAAVERTKPNFSHTNETGSGILQPGVVVSFLKLGDVALNPLPPELALFDLRWSWFDSRTANSPIIFPVGPAHQGARTISVRAESNGAGVDVKWTMRLIAGVRYAIESSTNLTNWTQTDTLDAPPTYTLTNSVAADAPLMFWRARRISSQ